jgi:photosystem II stability/assembly factor-like uncharacterized protein
MFKILLSFVLALIVAVVPLAQATVYYNQVAIDRSAKTIYAGNSNGIYVSTDSGKTWTKSSTCAVPSSLDISSDGQHAIAVFDPAGVCGPVQVTNNFGKTWSKPSFPLRANTMRDGDVSGNGQYMVAANLATGNGNDEIYVSNDYGSTFHAVTRTDSINLYSTVMNQAGDRIFVGQSVGVLFVSKDYGASFAPQSTVPYTGYYSTMSCNEDCSYLLATSTTGVTLSTDTGVSWNTTALPRNSDYSTVLSGSGQYQFAAGYRQNIYRSQDFGTTWSTAGNSPFTNWVSVDCDSTGQYVVASSSEKGIFLSSDYGNSWTVAEL